MTEKKLLHWLYLYTQTRRIDCFRRVHKILRWIGSSDLNCKINWQRFAFVSNDLDKVTNESVLEVFFFPVDILHI